MKLKYDKSIGDNWYNDVCRIAVDKRRKAKNNFIKTNTQMNKDVFIQKPKTCKSILQREKEIF